MPDISPDNVEAMLTALGLVPQDDEDLQEVTQRINAVREALAGLEPADLDAHEPLTVFEETLVQQ